MTTTATEAIDFLVYKKEIHLAQTAPGAKPSDAPLKEGQIRVHPDTLAFTANNITYAAFGEALSYWKHFVSSKEGWGRLPAWGFGEVVESRHAGIKTGERLYGYFPISTYVVIEPARVTELTLFDGSAHRHELPPVYTEYARVSNDPSHRRHTEAMEALIRPLFVTSYLVEDFFAEKKHFGAQQILISSASSKTAMGIAYLIKKRKSQVELIALTSARNADFTKSVGYYDRVMLYEDATKLDASRPAVFIDVSGDSELIRAVHTHFADNLKYSCQAGATHWEEIAQPHSLPGPKPIFFFAPDHTRRRLHQLGAPAFQASVSEALHDFIAAAPKWLNIVELRGAKAVETVYQSVLNGEASPAEGYVLSL